MKVSDADKELPGLPSDEDWEFEDEATGNGSADQPEVPNQADASTPAKPPARWWLLLIAAVVALVATLLLRWLLPILYIFGGFTSGVVIWLLLTVATTIYFIGYRANSEENSLQLWQTIPERISPGVQLSRKAMLSVSYLLVERKDTESGEVRAYERIEILTRKHIVDVLRRIWLPILLYAAVIAGVNLLGQPPLQLDHLPGLWRVIVVGFIVCALWVFAIVDQWRHVYFMLTNFHVWVISDPPSWLWFIRKTSVDSYPWSIITGAEHDSDKLGKLLRYGTLTLKTAMQNYEDRPIHNITYIPHVKEVASEIRSRAIRRV